MERGGIGLISYFVSLTVRVCMRITEYSELEETQKDHGVPHFSE